jgi:hypothetical protein
MADEPDSTPRRRPPTIELTATEVGSEKPAAASEPGAADPQDGGADGATASGDRAGGKFAGRLTPLIGGVAAGAIAMGAIIGALWLAGFAPSRNGAGAASAPPGATDEISAQLNKIEAALAAPRPEAALAERVAAADAQLKSLGDSLAALNRRVDDIATAAQTALARAGSASATADGAKSAAQASVQRSDLDALNNRIGALERAVKTLSDDVVHRGSSADDRVARMLVVSEALRAAVESGAPYQAELAAVKSLGADPNGTAALEPFAATGVPSAAALAHELAALTPGLLQSTEPTPGESTFLGRLENNAQRLVRVTPIDAPAGDDPASIIARINADAARADNAGALADIARLPEAMRTLANSWVKKADARNAALAASRRIFDGALATLGKPASQ